MSLVASGLAAAVGTYVAFAAVAATRTLIARRGKADVKSHLLQYAVGFRILMSLALGVCVAVTAFIALTPEMPTESDRILSILLVMIPLTAGTSWWFIESFTRRIVVTERELSSQYLLGSPTVLKWDDIRNLKYSLLSSWLVIEGPDNRRIRVTSYLDGAAEFADLLRDRLPSPVGASRASVIDAFARLAGRAV